MAPKPKRRRVGGTEAADLDDEKASPNDGQDEDIDDEAPVVDILDPGLSPEGIGWCVPVPFCVSPKKRKARRSHSKAKGRGRRCNLQTVHMCQF